MLCSGSVYPVNDVAVVKAYTPCCFSLLRLLLSVLLCLLDMRRLDCFNGTFSMERLSRSDIVYDIMQKCQVNMKIVQFRA